MWRDGADDGLLLHETDNTNDWEKAGKKFVNIREKTPIRVVRNIQDVSKFFSLMERSASSSASALTMGKNWIISVVTLLR